VNSIKPFIVARETTAAVRSTWAIRGGLFLVVGFGFHRGGTRKVNRCNKAIWLVIRV